MRLVTAGAVLGGVAALGACGGAPGDYYAVPPAVVFAQLETVEAPKGTGELSAIRDGDQVQLTLTSAGTTLAVLHAAVSPEGSGSRVVITQDPVVEPPVPAASPRQADIEQVNADVQGILHSRLNRQMMSDMVREQVAATLAHRSPDFRSALWHGARAIGRDASLVRDFADKVDRMQTDAAFAAFEAQRADAYPRDDYTSGGDPSPTGRPTPGVGQPMVDSRPPSQWTTTGDQK